MVPPSMNDPEEFRDPDFRANQKCTIFLSYTSNMISSGIRETIKYLVKNKFVCITLSLKVSALLKICFFR